MQPRGSIFQNGILTLDYHLKNAYKLCFNPIKPDPFEFLIRLRVCLRDTPSLTTI